MFWLPLSGISQAKVPSSLRCRRFSLMGKARAGARPLLHSVLSVLAGAPLCSAGSPPEGSDSTTSLSVLFLDSPVLQAVPRWPANHH